MGNMGVNAPISIFQSDYFSAEFMKSMRDLASLSAVLKDLSTEKMYDSPTEIIRFLNIIQLLNEASLGIREPIDTEDTLYYRYRSIYTNDEEPPTIQTIQRVLNILERNNWVMKQTRQIKLMDRGKRLMDGLIRMGNDALAYYLQDDIGRSLFQARRDAEISAAYDDKGISGGNKIASMIYNVEQAIEQLESRQLEFLADRNALPQLEQINGLMQELEGKMAERLAQFQTLEESLIMSNLIHRGTATMTKGTALSLSVLTKYIRFVNMQLTPIEEKISPEKVRNFILSIYEPPAHSNIPTTHDIFSFMEQNQYEGETFDGLWLPVKFAAPIGKEDIHEAVNYLEIYEPKREGEMQEIEEPVYDDIEIMNGSIREALDSANWQMMKAQIDTSKIENYLEEHGETEIEQLIVESSSNKWNDAILSMLALSALTSNSKIAAQPKAETKEFDKEWEWINDGDKQYTIRKLTSDD
ncbi:hypothetical protein [Metasolibacillus meyeri]|uniref:hypothetical protein n=1 Tax=Metasolibacillus meyeri TaxID=1071052 RepID=UPI001EE74B51|nr:hypothetical protein [Metasolibacillus meyeri]